MRQHLKIEKTCAVKMCIVYFSIELINFQIELKAFILGSFSACQ